MTHDCITPSPSEPGYGPDAASRFLPAASTAAPCSARPCHLQPGAKRNGPVPNALRTGTARHHPTTAFLIRSPRRPRNTNTWPEKRLLLQHRLHCRTQSGKTLPHVGHARRNPDPRARLAMRSSDQTVNGRPHTCRICRTFDPHPCMPQIDVNRSRRTASVHGSRCVRIRLDGFGDLDGK